MVGFFAVLIALHCRKYPFIMKYSNISFIDIPSKIPLKIVINYKTNEMYPKICVIYGNVNVDFIRNRKLFV